MTALVKLLLWIITKYELKWHYSVDEANFLLLLQPTCITKGYYKQCTCSAIIQVHMDLHVHCTDSC